MPRQLLYDSLNIASYYTFGNAGMIMSILLNIITAMRILDGITDPFIGTLIDKTETKWGNTDHLC